MAKAKLSTRKGDLEGVFKVKPLNNTRSVLASLLVRMYPEI